MKSYEIFQAVSPELGQEVFRFLREEQKEVYKSVLNSLAARKKLRPVFVQRKPADKQIRWMYDTCRLRLSEDMAENVLQIWLLKAQKDMLVRFLDDMGIEHDDDAGIEDLPEELDEQKLKSSVDTLLQNHPAEIVTLYLRMFQLQQPGGWKALNDLLSSDDRLFLGQKPEETATPELAPEEKEQPPAGEGSRTAPAAGGEEE